jgi:hypothetical protein
MMDKHGENCNCGCGSRGAMMMATCMEHKMTKEHLENKKKMLQDKLKWVEEELAKK